MGFTEETVRFKLDDSNKKEISETLTEVYASLNEKGYNPINQIVGYVLSGDPVSYTHLVSFLITRSFVLREALK